MRVNDNEIILNIYTIQNTGLILWLIKREVANVNRQIMEIKRYNFLSLPRTRTFFSFIFMGYYDVSLCTSRPYTNIWRRPSGIRYTYAVRTPRVRVHNKYVPFVSLYVMACRLPEAFVFCFFFPPNETVSRLKNHARNHWICVVSSFGDLFTGISVVPPIFGTGESCLPV